MTTIQPVRGLRVLVTGGAGFLGSHLVEQLVAAGAEVTVLDDCSSGSLDNLRAVEGRYRLAKDNVLDRAPLEREVAATDVIFHLAASAYVPPSVDDPESDLEQNCIAVLRVLEAARRVGSGPRVVIFSSAAVYGDPVRLPISEADPVVPISPYGVSKLAAERYGHVYAKLHGLRTASLRLFSAYGPRQRKQIVYDFLAKLSRDPSRLEVIGDGEQRRDLVFSEDVAAAAIHIAEHGALEGEVYNVAFGRDVSTRELAEAVARSVGVTPRLEFTGSVRPGDAQRWRADVTRIRELGFEARVDLVEGLDRTARWFETEGIATARGAEHASSFEGAR